MRSLYLPTDKRKRIAYHRTAATECREVAPALAEMNDEMVDLLEREIRDAAKSEERARVR